MKHYEPMERDSVQPWDGGLLNRTYTQHLVGQKMYELTSHLGNVQAVVSDQRYVKVGEDGSRLFRAVAPAYYDYYPFGQLIKERSIQDTSSQTMTATQMVNVPNIVTTPLPLTGWSGLYGATISYSGGVVASGTQGGMSRSLGGLVPGVMATVTVNMRYVRKLPFSISVIDDASGTVVANQNITSGPLVPYSLSFIPTGTNVTLRIEEGVGFTSSGTLLHLASGTYTQQQGWTTAPLAVQLSNKDADKYKFGFNGQEKVNEIAGVGNHTTALFWEYDTRIARRWNLDPVDQISISNYSVMRLNPIFFNDPLGDCVGCRYQGMGYKYEPTSKNSAELQDYVVSAKRPDHLRTSTSEINATGGLFGGNGPLNIWQAAGQGVGRNGGIGIHTNTSGGGWFQNAMNKLYGVDTWINNLMGRDMTPLPPKQYNPKQGGTIFTSVNGQNQERRSAGHPDANMVNIDDIFTITGNYGGSGGIGTVIPQLGPVVNLSTAVDLSHQANHRIGINHKWTDSNPSDTNVWYHGKDGKPRVITIDKSELGIKYVTPSNNVTYTIDAE